MPALQVTINAGLEYKSALLNIAAKVLQIIETPFQITGTRYLAGLVNVLTTPTALPVPAGVLGWAMFKNNDSTNDVELGTALGNSGRLFAKLAPGQIALFPFSTNVTAPMAIAHGGTVQLEYLILEA